jgi:hypothetical protein
VSAASGSMRAVVGSAARRTAPRSRRT